MAWFICNIGMVNCCWNVLQRILIKIRIVIISNFLNADCCAAAALNWSKTQSVIWTSLYCSDHIDCSHLWRTNSSMLAHVYGTEHSHLSWDLCVLQDKMYC